jgi:integrase
MPRKRTIKNHKGLPTGWRYYHGSYRYQVPKSQRHNWDGKTQFTLGKTLTDAYRVWAERVEIQKDAKTIGDLLEQYIVQVTPTKAPNTQKLDAACVKRLMKPFSRVPIHQLKPHHVYKYWNDNRARASRVTEQDISLLKSAYSKAVEWGLMDRSPLHGTIRLKKATTSARYVEDWEIQEFISVAPDKLKLYVEFRLMTSLRRVDILLLTRRDLKDDAIYVQPTKTEHSSGIKLRIQWTDELRQLVNEILALDNSVASMYLFSNRDGQSYHNLKNGRANGWESMWDRAMVKALNTTKLNTRFDDRSLRNKSLTDDEDLENARKRAGHTKEQITKTVYRLKGEASKPNRRKSTFK